MAAYAVRGTLVLSPTDMTNGGTDLEGVVETVLHTTMQGVSRRFRTGVGSTSGVRVIQGRVRSAQLEMEPRNGVANFIKILASHLTTDGTTLRPWGGTSNKQFTQLPTFAMAVRPTSTTENYLYSPAWAVLMEDGEFALNYADITTQLESSQLVLVACENASGPEFMYAAAAAIDTEYGL